MRHMLKLYIKNAIPTSESPASCATGQGTRAGKTSMNYYSLLGLNRDPFVTTPDPDIFFQCPRQIDLLDRLEIGVRLKRGLSVVLGPVGTGKSTLSRQLMRVLSSSSDFVVHLLLDPYFESEKEFLVWLNQEFEIPPELFSESLWKLKDNLKNKLFEAGVEQGKTVCLIVDEGQKMTQACLEVLRELLNYETNNFKLLQIVIFGQEELKENLRAMPNVADRVYQTLSLGPFSFKETVGLVRTRMELCKGESGVPPLFTFPAFLAIFLATRGYPRQIIQLCHKVMLAVIARGRPKAGWGLAWSCTDRGVSPLVRYKVDLALLFLSGLAAGCLLGGIEPVRALLLRALGYSG